ncbi:hypothetical protein VNO78_26202 [Psophocarpus tetragonolobus]|uniref:BHLH domain-containing protein n=1 Tax=Psophocarpus tetragonolobus TaxID=3891 RepID=A0AAN9RZ78_PSOTE
MDELWQGWLSILDTNDDYNLFSEHDNKYFEELEGENNSVDPAEISWENLHSYSCVTKETPTLQSSSSSLEENTEFDISSVIQQQHAASAERPKSCILSFEDSTSLPCLHLAEHSKHQIHQEKPKIRKPLKRGRNSSQTLDHILAERKRRETITRMFISLSALIPGLRKIDKASVLNNAVEYVKHLQQRVKDLEQEDNKKREIESKGCFKINKTNDVADEVPSCTFDNNPIKMCPKVEARVLGNDVLIRVTCEKQKNIVRKLLIKIEAHNLCIVCNNVLAFGNSSLNFTCIAKNEPINNLAKGHASQDVSVFQYCRFSIRK